MQLGGAGAATEPPRLSRVQFAYLDEYEASAPPPAAEDGQEETAAAAADQPHPPSGLDEADIFDAYLRPHLLKRQREADEAQAVSAVDREKLLLLGPPGHVLVLDGRRFVVEALELRGEAAPAAPRRQPPRLHVLDAKTSIFVRREPSRVLRKVCVRPYRETLPTAYEYDLLGDFVLPFFWQRPFREFKQGDQFLYHGCGTSSIPS
eukprot:TRINITY_DN37335_c0_g1_i2.p1 TRINITY_DN37335_c0_g1~~TRINITY_DN37335_c0_g1_i2.p1  ORF type:complete len:206 (+),score=52.30 TRINITY_DN37335_c0_g1_i2:131-748(+)